MPGPSGRPIDRLWVLIEVAAVFAAVHVSYRAIKGFTVIGRWEGAAGTNFTPGVVMAVSTCAILLLTRKDFRAYGLSLDRWGEHLSLGLTCTLVEVAFGAFALVISGYEFDASRPPDPHSTPDWRKLAVAAGILVAGWTIVLAMVSSRRRSVRGLPPLLSIALIAAVAAVPPVVGTTLGKPFSCLTVLWLFFGAGFGEETFYRGYIQSRVDEAWGRPWRMLGFEFGAGLLVSSFLFGLLHALNTVDYFHGRYDFGWGMGISSVFVGIYFGLIRTHTQSVLPGAIIHGLTDVLARLPNVLP
ncbi:MAG TPA: CPBP family intramembrane glutamic endopeptidase [Pirellulales bacterium]|nr:CPBP family intramembrane glutamic endopeptidase [Pirellulales bacterium]